MGQFSWLDCKTGEQIVDGRKRTSYLLVPREFGGGHIEEPCYQGYGEFGGHDVYDLVADWNKDCLDVVFDNLDSWRSRPDEETVTNLLRFANGRKYTCEKRWLGIEIACYDSDNARLRYPIKITHDPNLEYEWAAPSKADPNQGWPDEEEWQEEWEDDWFEEE